MGGEDLQCQSGGGDGLGEIEAEAATVVVTDGGEGVAGGLDRHIHVLVDRVELVVRAARLMWGVGDHPQPVHPEDHRADATFLVSVLEKLAILAALRIGGQVGIDAADFAGSGACYHFLLAVDHAKFHRGGATRHRALSGFTQSGADEGEADQKDRDQR